MGPDDDPVTDPGPAPIGPARVPEREPVLAGAPPARAPGDSRRERWLLAAILLLALALRWPGFTDPWSGIGFNAVMGSWSTGEFSKNFVEHGFLEAGLMPNRWRVELEDGTVVREWYAHHPVFYALVSAGSLALFGDHEWAIRLPWLVLSLLAVVALHRLLATIWDGTAALLGAGFLAVMPLAAHYAILPWVDTSAMPLAYALLLRSYVLWLRAPGPRTLRACALWAFAGTMLDWNMLLVVGPVLVHGLLTGPRGGRVRRALPLLSLPAACALAVAVHGAHMLLVMPREEVLTDTADTLQRATSAADTLAVFVRNQRLHLERVLTWPYLAVLALGLAQQLVAAARRRLGPEEGLLAVMALPGPIYVCAFPFRGFNHEFMWALSLLWLAATPALLVAWVARRGGGSWRARAAAAALALAAVSLCPGRVLWMWRTNRSDAIEQLVQQEWFRTTFSDPEAVALTSTGHTWMMLYHARTPIIPRVMSVAQLEELRRRVLSRLGPGRKVWFVFDLRLLEVQPELHAYLERSGTSERHLELLKADPMLAFDLFDLTEWAGS